MSIEHGSDNINQGNKKRKIVIADVDIEQQARDIAKEKLLDSKKDIKGFRGFFRKIWKHNLAHEYYRQKEIAKARREIKESGNIYKGENGEKKDHENAMKAIVDRFQMECESEGIIRKGEEKKTLKDTELHEKSLKGNIQDLIKKYASGNITEEQFILEKNSLFEKDLINIKNNEEKSIVEKGEMYADNLLEIARQVKQDIAHNRGLKNLDLDFDIIVGKAKTGVDTQPQYNAVDRIVEKIQKSFIGRFVNETTLASAVAIAYGIGIKGTVSAAQRASKLVGPIGLGLSAGIGGAVAGVRENKRLKEERAQHAREIAKGGGKIEAGSSKREEMEKFRYETRGANELTENLKKSLEDLKKNLTPEQLQNLLKNIAEIDSRIAFSDQNKIDLISFSDSKKVERERTNLYISTAEAKVFLKQNIGKDWASLYKDENELKEYLSKAKEEKIQNEFIKEKTTKDEAFQKMKKKKVAWAITKGLGIGLGVGVLAQEAQAYLGSSHEGVLNSERMRGEGVRHLTFLEYLRKHISGEMPRVDSSHLHGIALSQNSEIRIPEGFGLAKNPDGTFNMIQNSNHEIISQGLKFNPDGTLAKESQQMLEQKGIFASQFSNHIEGTKQTVGIGAKDYIKEHENLFSKIKRGGWADNDTPRPDKNELGLHWGGTKGTGIDQSGNFVFNVKHMTPEGSFHREMSWNPQELIKERKLKLLISLSKDTQSQVIEIPIDVNGNAVIDPNSEIGKIAFESVGGHAKFLGKFAEVAAVGENRNGSEIVHVLATHSGEGIKNIEYVIETPGEDIHTTVFDMPADYDVDLPYVIPMRGRRPLDKLGKEEKDAGPEHGDAFRDFLPLVEAAALAKEEAKETSAAEKQKLLLLLQAIKKAKQSQATAGPKLAQDQIDKMEKARAASEHTLHKLENYSDINAPTMEESDKKFLDLTRRLWTELTVHEKPDLDANSCLELIKLAGISLDINKVNFVKKGETADSGIIMDTSEKHGVIAEKGGKRLIMDHHGKESDRSTSATKFVYETLIEMGLLKREGYLDKFVEFVTKCDNEDFTEDEDKIIFENYSRNLHGLRDKLKIEEIIELFKKGIDPAKNLPVDYLKNHKYLKDDEEKTLLSFSGELRKNKERAEKMINKLEEEGFILDTGADRFGKILIDTKKAKKDGRWFNKVPQIAHIGRLAVRIKGFGGYLIWSDSEKSFVLYTKRKMDETSIPGEFPDKENVLNIRGNMLIKNANSTKPLEITLEDILGKLSGKSDFKIEGRLKEALEKETKERAEAEARAQQKTTTPTPPPQPAATPPSQPPVLEPTPQPAPAPKTPENLPMETSIKKLNGLFLNFELSYEAMGKEASRINVKLSDIVAGFIESNPELKKQYEEKLDSIDKNNLKEIEKLATLVIFENEIKKAEDVIKRLDVEINKKEQKITVARDDQKKEKLEDEMEDLLDKKSEIKHKRNLIGVDLIKIETSK